MQNLFLIAVAIQSTQIPPAPPVAAVVPPTLGATLSVQDRFAKYITASAPLADMPGWTADLLESGDAAAVRIRNVDGEKLYPLESISDVLMMLADRRVEGLWPALIKWGGPGPGLEGLRDRNIAKARLLIARGGTREARTAVASTVRPPIRAAILLADALTVAGRWDEANAILSTARGPVPGRGDWANVEWSTLSVRLAGYVRRSEGVEAALALLDSAAAQLGRDHPYTLNMDVTRAAMLVEHGRYGSALDTILKAEAVYRDQNDGRRGQGKEKVPGSDRQFAWIKACALHGLSRDVEAQATEASLLAANEPHDNDFVITNNISLRYRYAKCLRKIPLAERELIAESEHRLAGGTAFLVMQPASRIIPPMEVTFMRSLAASPVLASTLGKRFRTLPPEFEPALNNWRAAPATKGLNSANAIAPAPHTPSLPSQPPR